MKNKFFFVLFSIIIGFMACGVPVSFTMEKIKSGYRIDRGFEIAKLNVSKVSQKFKYPIEYEKEEIYVCLMHNDLNYLKKDFSNVDDYWIFQDSINFELESIVKRKALKEIYFKIRQENIK